MGKIGDLIVRLQLKYEDYQKGLKKADKETKGFAANLNKGINLVKAAWAGVGVAAVAAGKKLVEEMSKASNRVGDMMTVLSKQVGAVWHTMITSITAGFDNFLARAASSARAAKALQEMEDAEFEMLNSVALKRSEIADQLVQWEIDARSATKSYEKRKKAAEDYLEAVKDIYAIERDFYKEISEQSKKSWLESSSTPTGTILGYSESNAGALHQFLKEYGEDKSLQEAVKNYRQAWDEAGELWNRTESGKKALRWVNENRQDWGQTTYRRFALDLGWSYEEQHNDQQNGKVVKYIKKADDATAAFKEGTKRMQNVLNSLTKEVQEQAEAEAIAAAKKAEEALAFITDFEAEIEDDLEIEPIDWSAIIGNPEAELKDIVENWKNTQEEITMLNNMLEDAIVSSMSNSMQAITDMIAGVEGADAKAVLATLLQPFANTMTQLGEMLIVEGLGIKAFEESLKTLNPAVAIGAGVALLALGAALSTGIQALANTGGGASTATTSAAGATSSAGGIETYEQEITVHVVGEISGDKIVLAGQKTLNKWSR